MASIPAAERHFRGYVERAGYVDISAHYDECNPSRDVNFTVSTGLGEAHTVLLYAHAKPQKRMFTSMKSLSAMLSRWGFKALEVPMKNGTSRCYLGQSTEAEEKVVPMARRSA